MKNYTNLSVMKSSQVENLNLFKEETISSQEEFNKKVQKGVLYKAFEPPANATMLKFRYYNDENTLIEQNNVPVVYDGTSIKEIVNYYFLTNKSSEIIFSKSTWQADGWTKESQNVSRTKRYLWCVSETIYTNTKEGESGNLTEPIIVSVFGEQGERGAIYLGHYASTSNAYSDNKNDISSGDYFLNTADSFIYVYDKDANTWTKISDYSDYRYNQSINDIFENITDSSAKENFIKAKSIWVQNLAAAVARTNILFSNEITLTSGTDLSGKSTSGKIHSANYKSGSSGWQIDYAGNAEFNNAIIRGEIKGGTINIGENFSVDENGNAVMNDVRIGGDSNIEGLITQGTSLYFATRIIIRVKDGQMTITCSNPDYQDKVFRKGTGQFCIFHNGFKSYGIPRILVNYCSDIAKSDRNIVNGYFGSGNFSYFGTDPRFRLNCQGCGNYFFSLPSGDFQEYYAFCFTDNNTDAYIDPIYADLLVYYI